ncbi:hypothetical protein ACFE04_009377 [Oxalis oulophora]
MTSLPPLTPPLSPPSPSNSVTKPEGDDDDDESLLPINNNGALHSKEEEGSNLDHFEFLKSMDYIEKYKKYEADFTRRMMARYFTKKTIYGRNIFEVKTTVDDQVIMSSRWPGTRSYADPAVAFEDLTNGGSSTSTEKRTVTTLSNGKHEADIDS